MLRCECLRDPNSCMWRVDGRGARMGPGRQAVGGLQSSHQEMMVALVSAVAGKEGNI